uniref:Uncharacterized protein n=1 Tax=Mycena chlorophos TaxID=658473 RepID=A0ABQ0LMJ0_MYCCL|nr:predicted protein [Mycena chlorophos]
MRRHLRRTHIRPFHLPFCQAPRLERLDSKSNLKITRISSTNTTLPPTTPTLVLVESCSTTRSTKPIQANITRSWSTNAVNANTSFEREHDLAAGGVLVDVDQVNPADSGQAVGEAAVVGEASVTNPTMERSFDLEMRGTFGPGEWFPPSAYPV